MTYLELCNAVRADANVQGTIATVVSQTHVFGNIVRWVNDAYLDIVAEHDNWNFLQEENSITLPATFRDVDFSTKSVDKLVLGSLRLSVDSRFLQATDYVSFSRRYPLNGLDISTKKPNQFAILPKGDHFIRLNTIPDIEYLLYYEAFLTPTELSGNTDIPVLPVKFHDLIKHKALMKYGAYYNAKEVHKIHNKDYETKMKRLEFEYLPKNMFYTVPLV